jgi:hypothetical protein
MVVKEFSRSFPEVLLNFDHILFSPENPYGVFLGQMLTA